MSTRTEKLGVKIGRSLAMKYGLGSSKGSFSYYFKLLVGYLLIAPGFYAGMILLTNMIQQIPSQIHDYSGFNTEISVNLNERPRQNIHGQNTGEKTYEGSIKFFGHSPQSSGGKPVMLGLLAFAGVYLISNSHRNEIVLEERKDE